MAAWKEEAWVVLFPCGVRLSAEGQGAMCSPFHLSPGCIRGVCLVCVGWGLCFVVSFVCSWIAPRFIARQLPGANRASLSLNHGSLDDRQSLERARHELKKKMKQSDTHLKSFFH